MAEWRNGGMAEWRIGGRNGGMAERMAEWSNGGNGYICTLVDCRKTNPSLSWIERLIGKRKFDGESCYVARRYLIFPFLASIGKKFFDGEVESQTEMATYVLYTVDTHRRRQRHRRRRTLIFYSIDETGKKFAFLLSNCHWKGLIGGDAAQLVQLFRSRTTL